MPSSSSTLVNVAEDAELRLVRLLAQTAKSGSFVQDCEACISNADAYQLLTTIVKDTGALGFLFVLEPAEEAVSAFSLLAALLTRVGRDRPNEEIGLCKLLADAVVNIQVSGKDASDVALRQISLISVIYNMRSNGKEKTSLLAQMIQIAGANQASALEPGRPLGDVVHEDLVTTQTNVSPPTSRIVAILDAWEVPLADRRQLYIAAARGMPAEYASRKQRFLLLFVQSYTDVNQVDAPGLDVAKEAALGAIIDPVSLFNYQRNMLSLPAIQALAKNATTRLLYGLLQVFQEGKLDEYNAFVQSNGGAAAVLQPYGLAEDVCVRQMRILSLCSLSSEHEEIPYLVVAKTLLLPSEDEVESWVIAAVSSGLLSAKMDQLQQKVMVERCVVRKFDVEQWKILQSRLEVWKQNVGGVINGLKQSQTGAPAIPL